MEKFKVQVSRIKTSHVSKVFCEKSGGEATFSPFPFLLLTLFLGDSKITPLSSETLFKSPKSPSGFFLKATAIFNISV
eukprot:snap_masked-scaffold_29-processed-gene-0.17-mRNA-1 protein AED:1.00 eAED:1.00 QI:0/0/0/0/1/1/2/0/77